MKYLLLIILFGFLLGCNYTKNDSKNSLSNEFTENFKQELKELEKLEKSGEWKKTNPVGDEFQCPCCDYFTLEERGEYEICPICFWEDDGVKISEIDEYSEPNHKTLRQGRNNFLKHEACDSNMVNNVLDKSEQKKFRFEKRNIK